MKPADLAYLYSLTNEFRSIRYDLRNMQAFAAALGNPQESFESILIAGTNGKGSVASFLAAMMPDAGLYTSPHLMQLNERMQIGGRAISDDDLRSVFAQVQCAAASAAGLLYSPTYFEMVTAMAFFYFRDRVRFAVLEVGLGGRLDATNIVRQNVSVITSIGLDHQQFLGSTLDAIAAEKAGIIKDAEPVVIGPDADFEVIRTRAGSERLHHAGLIDHTSQSLGGGYFELDVRTPIREYHGLRPLLAGRHQIQNAMVAIRAAECLDLSSEQIVSGLNTAIWPGRLERFPGPPEFIVDGAHNVHAARALAEFLREFYPAGVWMIFGAMSDKDVAPMLDILRPHARRMIFTRAQTARARAPEELKTIFGGGISQDSVTLSIDYAREAVPAGSAVVICGSLYLVGEARAVLSPPSC
jgi:dihydrofolate synthase/folylpolyglutamate synthase